MPGQIDDIKSRLDLVELIQSYIRLHKAGVNYKANCPFHSEKTPSFVVSPARQIWHCFGCSLGGDHFKFVMQIEGLEFGDALELLAKRAGVELKREDPRLRSERTRLYNLVEDAAKVFEAVLHNSKNPDVKITPPLAYLHERGLQDETIKQFRIGFAPESWDFLIKTLARRGYSVAEIEKAGLAVKSEQGSHYDRFRSRIVFPISDASGRAVGFSGRVFGEAKSEGAKYINTPATPIYDKSRVLYGFDKAKEEIRKSNTVVLVEGQMDVVMSHQAGVRNAVAVSGTALAAAQLQILKRLASSIVSSFDRDAAGEIATKRSLDLAASFEFERKVAVLPAGIKDPAEAAEKDPAIWQRAVAEAKPIVQFFLETALARHDANSAAGKRAIAREVLPEIKILASEVEKAHWLQELSREIGIAEEALWRELKRAKVGGSPSQSFGEASPPSPSPKDASRRMQLESLLLGTLIRYLERGSVMPDVPKHAFLDERHLEILRIIESALRENVQEHAALMAAIPVEFHETANYLAFQAEVILERIESATERAREITVFMRELELEWARERVKALSLEIRKAEAAKDQGSLNRLLEEFRAISAKLS
ncbi:MAG: DNA primase [bacterium]|nr:DNA primase [bacterium]